MNKHSMMLSAFLAAALAGPALALPTPEFFGEAMEYMDERGIASACMALRVRVGKPSEIEVTRSSGDAAFDALAARGLHLEIDVMGRFPTHWSKPDAAGWHVVPLKFERPGRRNKAVLGCTASGAAR